MLIVTQSAFARSSHYALPPLHSVAVLKRASQRSDVL